MSSYERDRLIGPVPEIPRRPRGANSHHHPAIREIHKNAWLKRICSSDKKTTPFIKKVEKFWVVFCVHDDIHPCLEFYPDPKAAAMHKPISAINLNSCLHVSPSIIAAQDNEYEFAVTMPDQVIRLFAANWAEMNEWVESLVCKLRDMHILSPKDNLYSSNPIKLPETTISTHPFHSSHHRSQHIQHRDPNSPLPPPPNGYISPLLGIEVSRQDDDNATPTQSRIEINSTGISTITNNNINVSSTSNGPSQSEQIRLSTSTPIRNIELGTTMQLVQTFATDTVTHTISQTVSNQEINCDNLINLNIGSTEDKITITTHQQPLQPVAAVVVASGANSSNTSVVRLNFDQPVSSTSSALTTNTNCSSSSNLSNTPSSSTKGPLCLPPPPSSSKKIKKPSHQQQGRVQNIGASSSSSSTCNPIEESSFSSTNSSRRPQQQLLVSNQAILSYARQHSAPSEIQRSTSHENIYEHLYIPGPSTNVSNHDNSTNNNNSNNNNNHNSSGNSIHRSRLSETEITASPPPPPVIPRRNPKRTARGSTNNSTQRSSSLSRLEQPTGYTADGRRRHSRSRPADIIRTVPDAPSSSQHSFNENRPQEAMIGLRKGEYRIRSDDMSFTGNSGLLEGRYDSDRIKSSHVPLKEQQVMRLLAEIQNINGVRVVLKKKDCINSIAFVDYLGAVFICGWKQQQNILYYAFHIGDRVVKVAGVTVQNSTEAYRAIKMVSSMQVEFIIRRLPFGRVLVLKRKKDEAVGLVCTGNSGEIGEVVKNGLAFRSGLPLNCPVTGQTEGQNTCNWFLTEINNRPLSLMAKESEVKERLNAVGKEITITLQPSDICKHFKKHLKSVKNYKEYLVV